MAPKNGNGYVKWPALSMIVIALVGGGTAMDSTKSAKTDLVHMEERVKLVIAVELNKMEKNILKEMN